MPPGRGVSETGGDGSKVEQVRAAPGYVDGYWLVGPVAVRFAYELGALGGPLSGRGDAGGGGTTRRGYRAVRGGQEPGPQANSHASGTGDYHWDHA